MEDTDATRPDVIGYWLLYGVVSLCGAIGVCIAAGYALFVLPSTPLLLAAVWFGGILALAAVPTAAGVALDAATGVTRRHLDTTAGTLGSQALPPGGDSQSGDCSSRGRRKPGNRGCPCGE